MADAFCFVKRGERAKDFRERVIKAREDHEEATKIIKEFEPKIKKCIRMCIKDTSSFEDRMQEGRLAILNCIRRYDITSNVPYEGYVKMGVIYTFIRFTSKYRENMSLDEETTEGGGSLHDILDSGMDIERDVIGKERIRFLKAAHDKLKDSGRKAIEEFYFKGKAMIEMSRGRRCHYMTAVKHKEKVLDKLQKAMGRFIKIHTGSNTSTTNEYIVLRKGRHIPTRFILS